MVMIFLIFSVQDFFFFSKPVQEILVLLYYRAFMFVVICYLYSAIEDA